MEMAGVEPASEKPAYTSLHV